MVFSVIMGCSSALPLQRSSSPPPCFVPRSSVCFRFDHSRRKPISIRPSTSISGRGSDCTGFNNHKSGDAPDGQKLENGRGLKRGWSVSSDKRESKRQELDTGFSSPKQHSPPHHPQEHSSGTSSKSDNTSSILEYNNKGKEAVAGNLSDGLVAEGRVYEMKPELSKTIENYLQLMLKMNPKLQIKLQKFISATILLVNELTNEDKPPPSHD